MIHVRFVECFVAVERAVLLHEVDHRDVTRAISRPKLTICVLEYRNNSVVLVDKQTDIVLLDAAVQADCNTRKTLGFIFLDEVLDLGEVLLAVWTLRAEIIDEQRAVAEMAK